jgi:two-component system chemotaxis response regulator CheB
MVKEEKNIRVLLVDDSALVRDMIRTILESDPGIVIVGEASNGLEALSQVASLKPDIVTMDIEMPVMGGLEAIERIIAEHPVPILVVTAQSGVRTAFAAISKGALDVIEKPDISLVNMQTLVHKIRYLAKVDVSAHLKVVGNRDKNEAASGVVTPRGLPKSGIIAIAASTGGPHAIHTILSNLPAVFPFPIVITQHIAEGFTQGMVDWLNSGTTLSVVMAANGAHLAPGHVYLNPAEHSMRISEQRTVQLGDRDASKIYNPCCNILLSSAAEVYRKSTIGLIMSGMGDDGVAGMQAIKMAGGSTLAQDAESSVVYGMNRLAVERGYIHKIVPLVKIPAELMQRAGV